MGLITEGYLRLEHNLEHNMGREPPDSRPSTSTTCHVPQHILQDATVEVVQPFSRGVNAHDRVKLDDLIVDGLDVDRLRDHLVNLVNTGNLEGFLASQTEGSG